MNYLKSNPFQNCLFHKLRKDNDESCVRLVLHTVKGYLTKGNCALRFVALWNSLAFFKESTTGDSIHALMTDIFNKSDI